MMRLILGLVTVLMLAGCASDDRPSSDTAIKIAKELQLQEPFIHARDWEVTNGYSEQPGKYTTMIRYTAEFKKSPRDVAQARVEDLKARGIPWVKIPWRDAIEEHLKEKYGRYISRGSVVETEIKLTLTKTEKGWTLVDPADAPLIL